MGKTTLPPLSRPGSSSDYNESRHTSVNLAESEVDDDVLDLREEDAKTPRHFFFFLYIYPKKKRGCIIRIPFLNLLFVVVITMNIQTRGASATVTGIPKTTIAHNNNPITKFDDFTIENNDPKDDRVDTTDENKTKDRRSSASKLRAFDSHALKTVKRQTTLSIAQPSMTTTSGVRHTTSEDEPSLFRSISIFFGNRNITKMKASQKVMTDHLLHGKHNKEDLPLELVSQIVQVMDQSLLDVFDNLRDSFHRFQKTTVLYNNQ
ncbi:hypothetical protein RFI_17891 [Reticulomyxa filosa]|uniref:Uncharacterized protein n=1 Tax=Reticulomyxa filosa TaxID=46433 RepID=X6MZ73_RETFI|nr:hypothetical protein RFI_17891 [Reticulomyxa filosa]|eukprot:ETO19340.1 hypothetical protein RFI_17891 [Reticulomyxa filosa]